MSGGFALTPDDRSALVREITLLRSRLGNMTQERDYWRDEAEMRADIDRVKALALALQVPPSIATIAVMLYQRPGRVFSLSEIENAMPRQDHARDRSPQIVNVRICQLRKRIGRDAIGNKHGAGYYLTEVGVTRLAAAFGETCNVGLNSGTDREQQTPRVAA
jgi:DNA-binding response OmpR family regulator